MTGKHDLDGAVISYRAWAWMMNARRTIRTTVHDLTDMWPVTLVNYKDRWFLFGEDVIGMAARDYINQTNWGEFDVPTEGGLSTVAVASVHTVLVDELVSTLTKDGFTVVKMTMDGHSETITHETPENRARLNHVDTIPEGQ